MHASSTHDSSWRRFGIPPETWETTPEDKHGRKWIHWAWQRPRRPRGDAARAPGSGVITAATVLLGLLSIGLFIVSLAAQYRYLVAERHQTVPSMIEAVGLDVGMAIFSLLALGLAMAGQSARVERALIVACAAGSAAMNFAAANAGSPRSIAAYVVPPVFLAIVVDRVVAVVRRHVLGDGERSAWSAFGRAALYGLRFLLAAPSTARGLRQQVLVITPLPEAVAAEPSIVPVPGVELDELPEVPELPEVGERELEADERQPDEPQADEPEADEPERSRHRTPEPSKTARFLELVEDRHGPLAAIDPAKVSRIATDLAPEVGLHPGSARSALRPLVLAAQNGHSS